MEHHDDHEPEIMNSFNVICDTLLISCWNVNGWTHNNSQLRETIIMNKQSDIICLCETHLDNDNTIFMNGYRWYGFNRSLRNVRAPKASGGVGILIKYGILEIFNVTVIDKVIDGILGILLINKHKH